MDLLKNLTSYKRLSKQVFISGGKPQTTNQFCGVVLDPIKKL